jgi:hypothetical protein
VIYTSPPTIVRVVGHVDLVEDKDTHKMFAKPLRILRRKCKINVEKNSSLGVDISHWVSCLLSGFGNKNDETSKNFQKKAIFFWKR